MFSKLALRNVRRSLKDYGIYFLTLALGVCLFYLFNSIGSQAAMLKLSAAQLDSLNVLIEAVNYVSIFISVVLGFLIIYANGFLIRRRKKELGLYLTLGMEKGRLSRLLILETFLIGLFALAAGLLIGVFASQGFSVVTARMFRTNLSGFRFVFSHAALEKTLLYFGVIFLIVMAFNAVSISRLKLIDLLTAGKKNQEFRAKKLRVSVVCFLLSVALIGSAYRLLDKYGLFRNDWHFPLCLLLGAAGTLLFFFSLSGFILKLSQFWKGHYYRGLNMFTLRQFNSKINTTFVSVSIICLMLLVTIGTLSTGTSLANSLSDNVARQTVYDLSLTRFRPGREGADLAQALARDGLDLRGYGGAFAQLAYHTAPDAVLADLGITGQEIAAISGDFSSGDLLGMKLTLLSERDYNAAAALQGAPAVSLGADGYAILDSGAVFTAPYRAVLARGQAVAICGRTLTPAVSAPLDTVLETNGSNVELGVLIVPDALTEGLEIGRQILNVNFASEEKAAEFQTNAADFYGQMGDRHDRPYDMMNTKEEVINRTASLTTTVSYLILYIALVFLITSAAVLAIQQLSESSDNAERYALLRDLGADEAMISRALFRQIGLYFLLPLSLAVVHSYVGIRAVNRVVRITGNIDIARSTLTTALIFLVIYGGYFLATFFAGRALLRRET